MKRFCLGLALSLMLASGSVTAEEPGGSAIEGVIQSQIDAFLAQDPVTAFGYASPMIQGMFGTAENFGRMVQTGYPMIWKPSGVRYLGARTENGMTLQRVLVTDPSGATFLFDYEMVQLPEGWRINGVFPVRDTGVGA